MLTIVGFLLAILAIAKMLRQHRSPQSTMAWLLAIILLPYVGIPLYLLFGGRKLKRMARKKARLKLLEKALTPVGDATEIDRLLRGYNVPGATQGNQMTLCTTGEDTFKQLIDLIDSAKSSINITMFILDPDAIGKRIVDRLAKRAAEGVEVRVLLDELGSRRIGRRFFRKLVDAGGKIEFFMPVLLAPLKGRVDLRNHRKLVIIDNKIVMAGGSNIADDYIGPTPRDGRWRDLAFVLEGPAVVLYDEVFRSDWQFASGETIETPGAQTIGTPEPDGAVVQVVPSGPDVDGDPLYGAILSAVFAAKQRLWIVTPYFIPDEALHQSLLLAAHRGIDLRIVMPIRSDHRITDFARAPYLRDIQNAGGTIQLYDQGMIHAKAILVDNDLAMLGSANMDARSLFLNYEIALFTYSKREIKSVETWMRDIMVHVKNGVPAAGYVRTLFEGIVRVATPLL